MEKVKAAQLEEHSCWGFDCPKCGADHRVGSEVLKEEEFMCSECGEWFLLDSNAHLIAAAPELLRELKRAYEVIEGEYPSDDEIAGPVMESVKAAINKAEGR